MTGPVMVHGFLAQEAGMNKAFGSGADKKKAFRAQIRERLDRSEADTRSWHSFFYHSYFEGYEEELILMPDGRKKIIRNYKGPVYSRELKGKSPVLLKGAYLTAFAAMVTLFVLVAGMERKSDMSWYLAISELVSILALSGMGYSLLVNYLPSPAKMTAGEYRSASGMLRKMSVLAAAGFLISMVLTFLFMLTHPGNWSGGETYSCILFLVGAALAGAVYMTERRIPYNVTPGGEDQADNKYMIMY